ncbi:33820_t:CDS:2, partial [Gigaspora margarita]
MADQITYTNKFTDEPKDQAVQIEEKDKELLQYVRFKIIMLNEEYKSYRINMKNRFNMCLAQIFIALIAFFIGQILSIAKHINTTSDIGTIGSVVSSVFVIASTITTIFTVYLNNSSDKYFERNSNTEITGNLFKPMFLNIDFKILKNLYEFQKSDQSTDHLFRHSLFWLGEIWIVCIILSKSFDLVNNLEYRLNQNYVISEYFTEDSKSKEKKLGLAFSFIKYLIRFFNLFFFPYYWLSGRIVFRGFRDHNNQPSDDKEPLSGVNNDHSSDGEEQNPAWDIYFVCFVINNLELYPSEEFAIKSILNGAVFTEEGHEEKYDPGIINKTLS